jgi:glycosyltransferase involved in cell wall biosynthesis
MIFIVYCSNNANTIANNMGQSEYSYYFVYKAYMPLLKKMGQVIEVESPDTEVDPIYRRALQDKNKQCVFLSFTAPQNTHLDLQCPTMSVFAWEYPDIPNEEWDDKQANDWTYCLAQMGRAITHSSFAVNATKQLMGKDFPIVSAPAPIWGNYNHQLEHRDNLTIAQSFNLKANILDSKFIDQKPYSMPDHIVDFDNFISDKEIEISLSGVIYTSVFNPNDGRKNWEDMLTGFCYTFRNEVNATLLLKLSYQDAEVAFNLIFSKMKLLMPFACRIVLIQGYVDDESYLRLLNRTNYIVNTANGEGQCLPLMEYMSAGVPAIAPCHSAMLDYINDKNAFIIESSQEWTHWPHDPRHVNRTYRSNISWQSLCEQFRRSFDVMIDDRDTYDNMSRAASNSLFDYCSTETVEKALLEIFSATPYRAPIIQRLKLMLFDWLKAVIPLRLKLMIAGKNEADTRCKI